MKRLAKSKGRERGVKTVGMSSCSSVIVSGCSMLGFAEYAYRILG
jgi:hypothetical protein